MLGYLDCMMVKVIMPEDISLKL